MGKVKEKVSWHGNFYRGMLCGFNIIFMIGGIVMMAIGLWVMMGQRGKHLSIIVNDNLHLTAAFILVVIGKVVLVVANFGVCGARKESKFCLALFVISVLLCMVVEIAAAGVAFHFYNRVDIEGSMEKSLLEDYGVIHDVTDAWDDIQHGSKCCGIAYMTSTNPNTSYAGGLFAESRWYHNQTESPKMLVPPSCCIETTRIVHCVTDPLLPEKSIYEEGCMGAVADMVQTYALVIGLVTMAVVLTQILGLIMTVCHYEHL